MDDRGVAGVFNQCFSQLYNTVMLGGLDEPFYAPARNASPAELYYREDFAASALHEAAHWCIAGLARRQQSDFGYAYIAPPRCAGAQARFFASEIKAQALESIFARAAGVDFVLSTDELESEPETHGACARAWVVLRDEFACGVDNCRWQLLQRLGTGHHKRAAQFACALANVGAGADHLRQLARGVERIEGTIRSDPLDGCSFS